jgi:hypothetical protein
LLPWQVLRLHYWLFCQNLDKESEEELQSIGCQSP